MRKKILFVLLLITLGITGAWAEELSEKEAQQLAQSFANSHFGRKGGGSGLKSLGQVSGLYVFNMSDKGGFVIVSNESRTIPILGYSDSGTFDPDNMPENMRAWLQGYADEIAWLQKQKENNTVTVTKTRTRGGNTKADIAPLVTTKWNQGTPYNNLCHFKDVNQNDVVCYTGCAATAMAQVMYYTEKKDYLDKPNNSEEGFKSYYTTATAEIPSYTTRSYKLSIGSVAEGSAINWGKMIDDYSNSNNYNDDQATAVATLMLYCGCSINMDYGPEASGAFTEDVAEALVKYFDYDPTTTHIDRNIYSTNKWVDIIYHELKNSRVVQYKGISSDGGHSFVCDGYKYEEATDLFHINWGWGGTSDGYFVLSALNPDEQGIGGSTSNDGFRKNQGAIVGIQKKNGGGQTYDLKPDIFNLTMNSMTLSHSSVTAGTEVTATLNITNNNSTDYYSDIYLGYYNDGWILSYGDIFSIPARQTRDCVIKFRPTSPGTYDLCLFIPDTSNPGSYSTDGKIWASLPVVNSGKGIPTNLSVTEITSSGATLSWVDEGTASAWKVGYKAKGDQDFTIVNASTNPFTLNGLSENKLYTVMVRPASSESAWSPEFTFTTTAAYPAPGNLTVSQVTPTSAVVSWTGSASSYDWRYGVVPESVDFKWLQYDNDVYSTNVGENDYNVGATWGVMYPGDMVTGNKLTKVAFYIYETYDITMNIYSGGDNAPGTLKTTTTVTPPSNNYTGFLEVTFDSPVAITQGENLWITLSAKGNYPAVSCTKTNVPNNQWYFLNDQWFLLSDINVGWMIRGYIESEINLDDTWKTFNNQGGKSYNLTELDPTKKYAVQVRSNYDSDKHSKWVTAIINKVLELGNADDNNVALINAWNTNTTNVTLKGRTLYKDGKWNTLCLPFDLGNANAEDGHHFDGTPLEGAEIRTLTGASLSEGTLTLDFTDAVTSIAAGTPYIIKWTKADGYDGATPNSRDLIDPVFTGVTISNTRNDITPTGDNSDGTVTFKGTYNPISFDQANEYVLFMGDNNTLYYPQSGAKINSCRAYFKLNDQTNAVRAINLNFGDEGEKTGITTTNFTNFTNSSDAWYDLSGRRLSGRPSAKGLYINNGKKVVVK